MDVHAQGLDATQRPAQCVCADRAAVGILYGHMERVRPRHSRPAGRVRCRHRPAGPAPPHPRRRVLRPGAASTDGLGNAHGGALRRGLRHGVPPDASRPEAVPRCAHAPGRRPVGPPRRRPADLVGLIHPVECARHATAGPSDHRRFPTGCTLTRRVPGVLLYTAPEPLPLPLVRVCPRCGGPHGKATVDTATDLCCNLPHHGNVIGPGCLPGRGRGPRHEGRAHHNRRRDGGAAGAERHRTYGPARPAGQPAAERSASLAEAVRVLARPLDLTDRMTHAALLHHGPQEHVLVRQFHPLIADGAFLSEPASAPTLSRSTRPQGRA